EGEQRSRQDIHRLPPPVASLGFSVMEHLSVAERDSFEDRIRSEMKTRRVELETDAQSIAAPAHAEVCRSCVLREACQERVSRIPIREALEFEPVLVGIVSLQRARRPKGEDRRQSQRDATELQPGRSRHRSITPDTSDAPPGIS